MRLPSYITNLADNAKRCQKHIRSHWGVENKLHWILGVAFDEDKSRKRGRGLKLFDFIKNRT